MWILLLVGVGLIIVAAILLWTGRETQRLVNILKKAVPTTADRIPHAFPGELVSITGASRSDDPLISEHSQTPCLYYSCSVEREYETTEYTSATKDQPSRRTTRRQSETISSDTRSAAFFIEDETGQARVVPEDAEFDARETMNRFEPATNYGGGSFAAGLLSVHLGSGDRTLGYRYQESIIPVGKPVFVLGEVTEDGEIARPGNNTGETALVVSHRTREALIDDWQESARWQGYGSLGSATVGIGALFIAAIVAIL